jgi:putative transposase
MTKRNPSLKVKERNEPIVKKIEELKAQHPFWGYRRVWAHLTYVNKLKVNKKRIYRLMKIHGLIVNKTTRLKAKRKSNRPKPQADKPNQLWGIDMTKFKTAEGWSYLVVVLDWYSKKIVGHHLSQVSRAKEWLAALEDGVLKQFENGARGKELKLVSDNGCQPTSTRFMKSCHHLEIEQIFTSYNNPKGNAETERMMRTLKEELIWLKEWSSHDEAKQALGDWIEQYNASYLHSANGYRSPTSVEKDYRGECAA